MNRRLWTGIGAAFALLLLILDTKTAISGAGEGLRLCIMTVVPSLFPFFLLSSLLTSAVAGSRLMVLSLIGKLLRIPRGSESILIVGALGGYPMGAQAVNQAYTAGVLKKEDARRMLGFCCYAGPAFLFGIIGNCFTNAGIAWVIWGIHLVSGILTGILLPGGCTDRVTVRQGELMTLPQALERSLTALIRVCGWIIVFRIVIAFADRWFMWLLDPEIQIIVSGLGELTIGCTSLLTLESESLRFVVCVAFLGFGGLCVALQTVSVTEELGLGMYLPGKVLQTVISVLLALIAQYFLYPVSTGLNIRVLFAVVCGILIAGIFLLLNKQEKSSSIFGLVRV